MIRRIAFDVLVARELRWRPEEMSMETITLQFESDNTDPMSDAKNALAAEMGSIPYTIMYWCWLD